MLSLNQTFDETRAVKVLVVPIGNNTFFDKHFQIVSNLREIPFYELNRPYNTNSSAFKYFNWNDGNILFDFIRYDRALISPGDLNDFQSSRRILMIMGLINYPEIGETKEKIEAELEYFARQHQHVTLKRIFVFNYAFDDPVPSTSVPSQAINSETTTTTTPNKPLKSYIKDPNSLIIFPPEGICEGGVSMIDVHLKEIMSHASLSILLALEQQMKVCEESRISNRLPEQLPLSTLYDEIEEQQQQQQQQRQSSGSGSLSMVAITSRVVSRRMHKKKPSGRIHKWMGDLSMQVCSPRDAIDHYAHAITDGRALNETLWLAGALDGYASAVLLLVQMTQIMQQPSYTIEEVLGKELLAVSMHQVSVEDTTQQQTIVDNVIEKAFRIAEERMNEAISIYSNNIIFCALEVECILRAARIQELVPINHGQEMKVMTYLMKAISVDGLNIQQQIECMLESGLICYRLGMKRKYALFLFLAAILSIENENFSFAQTLLNYTCSTCHSLSTSSELLCQSTCNEECTQLNSDMNGDEYFKSNKFKMFNLSKFLGWKKLKFTLFLSCVLIADQQDDTLAATHELGSINFRQATSELLHYQDDNTSTSCYSDEISLSDILEYLSKVLLSRMYSEEVFDLFARLSKLIAPQSFVELPITLLSVQAIELIGCKKPIAVISHHLDNARENSTRYKQCLLKGLVSTSSEVSEDLSSTPISDNNNNATHASSLFYDPFAAKRKKELDLKKKVSNLCWVVGELCKVKANFQNLLSIPLSLDSVWPIFVGAEHEVHSTPIQIPPNTESFEVTLSLIPLHIGILKLIGIQVICNNATCILEVDETGQYKQNKAGVFRPSKSEQVSLKLEAYTITVVPPSPTLQIITDSNEQIDENIIDSKSIANNNNNNTNSSTNSTNSVLDFKQSQAYSEYADTSIHLSLYPGEERDETIYLRSIPSSRITTSNDVCHADDTLLMDAINNNSKEAIDMYENDYKVYIKQYHKSVIDNNISQHIVLNYNNTFIADQNSLNVNLNCSLNSYHNVTSIQKQDYYGSSSINLSTLTFKFIDDPNLDCIDIVIEIVNMEKKTSNFIKDFQMYDETNTEVHSKYSIKDIESIDLTNIYTRKVRLRVFIHHLPGLLLTRYYQLLSPPAVVVVEDDDDDSKEDKDKVDVSYHIHLPIPDYEAQRLSQSLAQLLRMNQKYSSLTTTIGIKKDDSDHNKIVYNSSKKILIDSIASSVKVVYEITNKSDRNIYVGTKGMQIDNISLNLTKQISKCMLITSDTLTTSSTPIIVISPKSCQTIIIEYEHYLDMFPLEKDELYLFWNISDADTTLKQHQRSGKIPLITNSNNYKFMNISNKYRHQNQITRKSFININSSIYKTLHINNNEKLSVLKYDNQLGNLYLVKVGKFVTMTIEISRMISDHTIVDNDPITNVVKSILPDDHEIELAIVVVNNESPHNINHLASNYTMDPSSIINTSSSSSSTTSCECIITGRRYMKYLLLSNSYNEGGVDKDSQQQVIQHNIQLCFPKEGSYSVYPLVRVVDVAVHNNKQDNDRVIVNKGWWTSPTAYIRVISSNDCDF